jgi:hypothetical protein
MDATAREFVLDILYRATGELAAIVFALIAAGIPLGLALYLLVRRTAAKSGVNLSIKWSADGMPEGMAAPAIERETGTKPAKDFDPRSFLAKLYRALMLMVAMGLLGGAGLAFWAATPGNGLLLVAGLLFLSRLLSSLVPTNMRVRKGKPRSGKAWRAIS